MKRFGAFTAVDDVSLKVAPGEVLALVGENGAGKSTLIQVACGLYRPDAGEVRVNDARLPIGDPRAAIDAGVGVVYQHFMLVGPLPVWENVVLGREPRAQGLRGMLGVVDRAQAREEIAGVADRAGLALDLDAPVETLGVGAQQRVEIVKQLWRGAKVLILDEPTAVLGPSEADELVRTMRKLAAEGRSIVFISHKLREVLRVADRIAVLRRGRLVLELPVAGAQLSQLTEAIMGTTDASSATAARALLGATAEEDRLRALGEAPKSLHAPRATPRLIVRGLSCDSDRGRPALRALSFEIGRGELLGLAGVDGNGQAELAEVLTGLRRAHGSLTLDGVEGLSRAGWARTAGGARGAGVVSLPADRLRHALCLPLSLEENAALGHQTQAPYARGPWRALLDRAGRRTRTQELLTRFDVRPPDPLARAGDLSGGNQQKFVVARELQGGPPPNLVVAMQPTRGLDLLATRRVWAALRAARDQGAAVLVASLDLDELRAIADRIVVLFDGRATGETGPAATDDMLGPLMLGSAPGVPEARHA